MFSLAPTKLKLTLSLIVIGLSLLWIGGSSAKELSTKELSTQAKDSLPYVVLKEGLDLAVDGREASKKQIPVLIFFSMQNCPFCIEVEEDYLKPMLRNSEYESKVLIRKIRIDGSGIVRDFKGKEREASKFSEEYNVSMVPTLILVDSQGKKIAPAIIGIVNSHYYSGELDDAIDASLQKIQSLARR